MLHCPELMWECALLAPLRSPAHIPMASDGIPGVLLWKDAVQRARAQEHTHIFFDMANAKKMIYSPASSFYKNQIYDPIFSFLRSTFSIEDSSLLCVTVLKNCLSFENFSIGFLKIFWKLLSSENFSCCESPLITSFYVLLLLCNLNLGETTTCYFWMKSSLAYYVMCLVNILRLVDETTWIKKAA